jgi:hypothetical protein
MTESEEISSLGLSAFADQFRNRDVTQLMRQVRDGRLTVHDDDVQVILDVWIMLLTRAAEIFIAKHKHRVVDPEAVASETVMEFITDLQEGLVNARGVRNPIHSRKDLWRMLQRRLKNHALNSIRDAEAEIRGGGEVGGESAMGEPGKPFDAGAINQFVDYRTDEHDFDEDPEFLEWRESLVNLIRQDKDTEKLLPIALRLVNLESAEEISEATQVSRTGVYRKIRIVRERWRKGLT